MRNDSVLQVLDVILTSIFFNKNFVVAIPDPLFFYVHLAIL